MRKTICKLAFMAIVCCFLTGNLYHSAASAQEQFAQPKGAAAKLEGQVGLCKENICKSPKLCESLEIDLLCKLQALKVPVYLPQPGEAKTADEVKIALQLGMAFADALGGIVNQDKAQFLKYAGIIQAYGRKLGVAEDDQYNRVMEAANKGDWASLGTLIYTWKEQLLSKASEKNKDIETLAMVAGGLEGLYLMSASVAQKFSPEAGKLLSYADFAGFMETQLKSLSGGPKNHKEIQAIMAALPKIKKMTSKPRTYSHTQKDAEELFKLLGPLHNDMAAGA